MPKCKNDPNRTYIGNEPSPKGLGICAHAEKINSKKKGKDGNMWIVTETKKGVKKWTRYYVEKKDRPSPAKSATLFKEGTKKEGNDGNMYVIVLDKNGVKKWKKTDDSKKISKKTSKKSTKKSSKKISKKTSKKKFKKDSKKSSKKASKKISKKGRGISLESFYDLKVIKPKDVYKYISHESVLKKVVDKIKPEIEKQNIKFYIIPLPISGGGIYWTDYANSYMIENYGNDYDSSSFIYMTIYFEENLEINYKKNPDIFYPLNKDQQKIVADIFVKHLPYNYDWDGNDRKAMNVVYKKKSSKAIVKIGNDPDYPEINLNIFLKYGKNKTPIDVLGGPLKANEFKNFEKLDSKCKFIDYGYSNWDFDMIFTGVKDLKYVKDFLNKLRKGNKLTFGKEILEIEKFEAILYKSKEDAINDKYSKI